MLKKYLIVSFFITLFSISSQAAGTDDSSAKVKSNYDKAVSLIKQAKKYEKKGKTDKANKRYEKAQKLLLKSNKKKPLQADTLNYLGFTTRKLGDYENGEKYYLLGLEIDPNHKGINEYLGELYVVTNRIDLAKERLNVLENCNCEEYGELKEIIDGTKTSKY
ncbi:tetratricopeptide repeat protein [Candidatus Pelagibacter bacterium nBUS_29]|jgi:tetratricopeptide (TPR) repeat protein|uniref:tetratricopeptide repeat protein n=1 Tax=Candidatus Pelagibacter bacterium nBUS_29 TaxID=3374190 RepID=UPI003EBF2F32